MSDAYNQGKKDFAAAVERGEADGWLSQFAPVWYADAEAALRERLVRDIEALGTHGFRASGARVFLLREDVLRVVRGGGAA